MTVILGQSNSKWHSYDVNPGLTVPKSEEEERFQPRHCASSPILKAKFTDAAKTYFVRT